MGEIAISEREIILFYNPKSVIAKKTLAYAIAEGLKIRDVDIINTPLTGTQLEELADKLHLKIDELVNKEHPEFKKSFGNPTLSDEDWIKLMRKNPEFIKEPIAIRGDIAILVKTPSDIIKI